MTEKIELRIGNPPKNKAENGQISATPENLLFLSTLLHSTLDRAKNTIHHPFSLDIKLWCLCGNRRISASSPASQLQPEQGAGLLKITLRPQ